MRFECQEKVEVCLPHCNHQVTKPCFQDISTVKCPNVCEYRLPCGHSCEQLCHPLNDPEHLKYKCEKPCTQKNTGCSENRICAKKCFEDCGGCYFQVEKILNCGHVHKGACSVDIKDIICRKKCEKVMTCGHTCPRKCSEICGGCQMEVVKKIPQCGHEAKVKCCDTPQHSTCRKQCKRKLACGHDCTRPCGLPCSTECGHVIPSPVLSACGHSVEIPCFMTQNLSSTSQILLTCCKAKCEKILACGHRCKGNCGVCMQGRIHNACQRKCERNNICGHKCRFSCSEACPPCDVKCQHKCSHSICPRKCGAPCIPCQERCVWRCEHLSCTKLCYQLCDREPCCEPCKKKLKCGHNCIGFCGDPCPPLCRICNKNSVKEIFFGTEDEDDARFVYLVDCKHTLESQGLQQWLKQHDAEIGIKVCPKCKTNIIKTQRFMNYVKKTQYDVQAVKNQVYGKEKFFGKQKKELLRMIDNEYGSPVVQVLCKELKSVYELLNQCRQHLQPVKHSSRNVTNYLSRADVECLKVEIHILKDLLGSVKKVYKDLTNEPVKRKVINQLDFLVKRLTFSHLRTSKQETKDFQKECDRFSRFSTLAVVECSSNFNVSLTKSDFKQKYEEAASILNSIVIYSPESDGSVKEILNNLSKSVCSIGLSDVERKEIIHAMNFQKGHWYKCPNGHIYCIGECGGAMQVSVCPECKEAIGGSNHRLLPANSLATEMDGATRHAYPGGLY